MLELLFCLILAPWVFNTSKDSPALRRSWDKQRRRNQGF